METSYDVRIHKTQIYKGKKTTTRYVRWSVAAHRFKEPFKTRALAESFRGELISAASKGEAFFVTDGLPVSKVRSNQDVYWYEFACQYVDMKWNAASANYRRSIAEALTTVTIVMLNESKGRPDGATLRRALCRWAFNKTKRDSEHTPRALAAVLKWVAAHTKPVSSLGKMDVLRNVLDAIAQRIDGKPSAATVIGRKRAVLANAIGYAMERKILAANPLTEIAWTAPKASHVVDKRSVVNPIQARTLLIAIRGQEPSGPRLVAFFGLMYYAALRPEEAVNVRRQNVCLPPLKWNVETQQWEEPDDNWGELYLERATPDAGADWTDSGKHRDERQLKHRAVGEGRTVPIAPELTILLRQHLASFEPGDGGRLFTGVRAAELPRVTYDRAWRSARAATFTDEYLESPLARTPYTLRHACVSTWLNGGVPATQVAEWAGHSVDVLLKVYAKCLHGQQHQARKRIEAALRQE